jgi:hypothetical protein
MGNQQQAGGKIKVSFGQALQMLWPYAGKRLLEQLKSVALIIVYLMCFQTLVLGIAIGQAALIALGLSLVIGGLAFFMEGLILGLMPLGEVIGLKLPRKSTLPVILAFAFILGMGATLAEPAISVLKAAGSSVKPWEAPLLFLMLNRHAGSLVAAVGVGVGIAVVFGMIRFMYDLSLKPFIYILVSVLLGFTLWAFFNPNMQSITGLAWDCGAVTTGPVTVPLVLALGIGICRVVGSAGSGAAGFGIVTLASLFPILSVLILGAALSAGVPQPQSEDAFFSAENRSRSQLLFSSREEMVGFALQKGSQASVLALFDGEQGAVNAFVQRLKADGALCARVLGSGSERLARWAVARGSGEQQLMVFGDAAAVRAAAQRLGGPLSEAVQPAELLIRNVKAAVQAIVPLALFFLLVLTLVLRERLPRADEVFLGLALGVFGMMLFNIGIEIGLSKLGNQVGDKVPSAFKSIELTDKRLTINQFDTALVRTAITPQGEQEPFFYVKEKGQYTQLPYRAERYAPDTRQYTYTPLHGPLFGREGGLVGIVVVLLFSFVLGYGATLAEPALNALGLTVEELTVGAFKKSLLMQTVAIGVGVGIAAGVAKIIWDIPLLWLMGPPYVLLLLVTKISSEEYVNIGWDSAGVTTGPITVPLVLAMGLGIGTQVGVVEGFGILSMASVTPILAVLLVGLMVNRKRAAVLRESAAAAQLSEVSA